MNEELIDKQTKQLVGHMNDYMKANQLKTKGEAAIFDKHRQPDKQFGPGLNEELTKYRQNFAKEWGAEGWRNTQFVKQQVEESQRPTEGQMQDMHKGQAADNKSSITEREQFLDNLKQNSQTPKKGPKPGIR